MKWDVRSIIPLTIVVLAMAAVLSLFVKLRYVDCFEAELPPGTHIYHFERCIIGVQAADENGRVIPWNWCHNIVCKVF
jgi:uncharacterized protein YbaA (DUF1428 family)